MRQGEARTLRPARGLWRRISGNVACLLSGKAAAGLISLAYIALSARALGPKGYGVLSLAYGFALLVGGIVRLQPGPTLVRYGAIALAQDDHRRVARLARRLAGLELAVAAAGAAAAGLIAPFVVARLGWAGDGVSLALFAGLCALATVRSTPSGLLQLLGRFDLIGVQTAVEPIVRLAGVAVVLAFHLGLPGFLAIWALAVVVECAAMWGLALAIARRRLRGAGPGHSDAHGLNEAGLWRFLAASNLDATLHDVTARLPHLTVGWVLGPAAAGLYAVAVRATNIFVHPAQVFADGAFAEFARHFTSGGARRGVGRLAAGLLAGSWTVALPVLGLLLVFGPEVAQVLGGVKFLAAAGVISWLALAGTIRIAVPALAGALAAQGRAGAALSVNLVSIAVLYPLLPLLLMRLSVIGAGVYAMIQSVTALGLVLVLLLRGARRGGRSMRLALDGANA